jgi:DNA-binding CsgD family transcriptional regulator
MNYQRLYNNIVENRKINPLSLNEYGETHHITPKSLGGVDDSSNLIRLTAREHYICHLLLSEMYEKETFEWYKMNHAFQMMNLNGVKQNRYFNSRIYELKRIDFRKTMSWAQSGNKNSQYGKKRSDETKEKIRASINKRLGKDNNLTAVQIKKLKRQKEIELYTVEGKYYNKQTRDKMTKMFNIDLTVNFFKNLIIVKEKLHNLYIIEKKSTTELSKLLGVNDETIRNYLILFNIPRRGLSESIKNYYK